MTIDEIKKELQQLTGKRRAGVEDSLMSSLRQSLTPDAPRKLTYRDVEELESALEAKLDGWWLIWDSVNQSYGIIPVEPFS